jgi:hypothetical protein
LRESRSFALRKLIACSRDVLVKLTKFEIASSVGSDVMVTATRIELAFAGWC